MSSILCALASVRHLANDIACHITAPYKHTVSIRFSSEQYMDEEVLDRGLVENDDFLMTRGDASGEEKSSRLA